MRWSIRSTLLVLVLPLTIATLTLSAARILDLITIRDDIASFRESAFRSIYAERYARYLEILLKESFDHLSNRDPGFEAVTSARAGLNETLERLRPVAQSSRGSASSSSELTRETVSEWQATQEQIDVYLGRAVALARKGEESRARRLVMDDLEVLIHGRILSTLDQTIQREQEVLEEYRVRISRATEHWLARYAGAFDLRERLVPEIYQAILGERFIRHVHADRKDFVYAVLEGRPYDASHGDAANHALTQLDQLQRGTMRGDDPEARTTASDPAETYALVRQAYARTLALPAASRYKNALTVIERVDEVFDQTLLPPINAIVWAHERSIDQEMARLDRFAQGLMSLTAGMALIALTLGLGSPFLVTRLLVRPVKDLVDTVASFRSGDKDARPKLRARNELGILARALKSLLGELQESGEMARSLACYDSITGLPNRQFFEERLRGSLTTAKLQGRTMSLLSLNISGLKQVNETLGRRSGDELIRQIASRLRETVRLRDIVAHPGREESPMEVSRMEGDEFTVLLTKVHEAQDAAVAAQRVLSRLDEPFELDGREIAINVSIGIGVYPQDGGDAEALLRNAGAAMNDAIRRGGNHFQFFSDAMNVANSRKLHIQSRLGGAIERGDLELHYQPVRDARDGHLTGGEALLRWTDSEMGPVGPDEFIPIAEQSGMVTQIGTWVLERACSQARAWQDAGYPEIRMSVNVSASQLRDEDWSEQVKEIVQACGLSPGLLELEITETTIIKDDRRTVAALTELSELGVGIVLDDFGTGYSSLSHLKRLPIARIKIDRSFVSEISEGGDGAAIASAVIGLAHSLKIKVVAEGVETHEQAKFLRGNGCDELQGYLISRAVPPNEFEQMLQRQKVE